MTEPAADANTISGPAADLGSGAAGSGLVLPYLLHRRALDQPNGIFVTFETGAPWTWGDTHRDAASMAAGLRSFGVSREDALLIWLPNAAWR